MGNGLFSLSAHAPRKVPNDYGTSSPYSLRRRRALSLPPPRRPLPRPTLRPLRRGAPRAGTSLLTPAHDTPASGVACPLTAHRRNHPQTHPIRGCLPPWPHTPPATSARQSARHNLRLCPALLGPPWRTRTTDDPRSSAPVPRRTTHVETRGLHNLHNGGSHCLCHCSLCVVALTLVCLACFLHSNT